MEKIKILYEDSDVLVCYKPAGIAVQSSGVTIPDMETALRSQILRSSEIKNKSTALHVIHRLDQPVEGIIVFARNKKAAASLSSQVQSSGDMNKTYLAVVYGKFAEGENEGELRNYIYKDTKTKMAVITDNEKTLSKSGEKEHPKECLLKYKAILETVISESSSDEFITLVKIHLETGRYHQIRAQFSNIGHPLLGDRRYSSAISDEVSKKLSVKNVALCAYKLSFKHPSTGKLMEFEITPSGNIFNKFHR
ncbi:RluA family pseudouridine synthase [Butyrivibrio sp. AE3004]|uniref:RluA family pseudouridine synthase n=1 Tax=Butyrivibrio sp. AE3004 TaxID=1506994 RepID=UPI000494C0A2|nr:RluA family pseudouridine synthase [Butyrivibrio sp. AE3004]